MEKLAYDAYRYSEAIVLVFGILGFEIFAAIYQSLIRGIFHHGNHVAMCRVLIGGIHLVLFYISC